MAVKTTCIGAYPKPDWLPVVDWFKVDQGMTDHGADVTRQHTRLIKAPLIELEDQLVRATQQAVRDQIDCGIDVPSDGEQRRENYIHYHCRHLTGFDFENLTRRVLRQGAYETSLPAIRGAITARGNHFLDRDYKVAAAAADRPVKITVPGPITIMDTTANAFYDDERKLAFDLAEALNFEIRALADAGCRHIQVDEPLFARKPQEALAYGVEALERCFHGVSSEVTRVVHMCCGYPNTLDDETYLKADPQSYFTVADAMDEAAIDQLSLEDAHRHNDLALLEKFKKTTIILGAVAIARSRVESRDEIVERLKAALEHIDPHRLIAAPDCGLGFLSRELAMEKLSVLCKAAAAV